MPDIWWFAGLPSLAFLLSLGVAEAIRRNAARLRLIQTPNERSSHNLPTPSGAGIGIALAGTLGGLLLLWGAGQGLAAAVVAAALAAGLGFLDDLYELPARLRFAVQTGLVAMLLAFAGPLPELHTPLGAVPQPLLYAALAFAGVWWINLFNFMDGIDGIAATEAIFIALGVLALGVIAAKELGEAPLVFWMLTLAGGSLGFLVLNFPPARVFMGDVGSNFLAMALLAATYLFIAAGTLGYAAAVIIAASFVADASVTLLSRIIDGQRWFAAHRLHAYQKLSRRWQSHGKVTALNAAICIGWLLPLAALAQTKAAPEWGLALIAYLPLVAGCILLKAGLKDETGQMPGTPESRGRQ